MISMAQLQCSFLVLVFVWCVEGPVPETSKAGVTNEEATSDLGPDTFVLLSSSFKPEEVTDSFQSPSTQPDSCAGVGVEEREDLSSDDGNTELTYMDQQHNVFANLYYGFSRGISTVFDSASSAKDHLFTKLSDVTVDFADKVRKILKHEFFDLFADGLVEVFNRVTAPGMFV